MVKIHQPREKQLHYEFPKSAAAEEGVLRLIYYEPSLFYGFDRLTEEDFSVALFGRFFTELRERTKHLAQPSLAPLAETFSNAEISVLTEIINDPVELSQSEKALNDYINIIKTEKLARRQTGGETGEELLELANKLRQSKGYGG